MTRYVNGSTHVTEAMFRATFIDEIDLEHEVILSTWDQFVTLLGYYMRVSTAGCASSTSPASKTIDGLVSLKRALTVGAKLSMKLV